ncbi:hypothetical protein [Stutzerimonas stutzeri]|uniref:hypothetical protein n=1 Tax=Stutzerimonas stutzeri TaxID=316 RepID=UPI0003187AB1|nr:hypothetical protein [Stutzerimonas stutzeri]
MSQYWINMLFVGASFLLYIGIAVWARAGSTKGWSEVALYFWLTSASADFESGQPIKNDQIARLFLCF